MGGLGFLGAISSLRFSLALTDAPRLMGWQFIIARIFWLDGE
jgi:hypothetical protein